MKDQPRRALRPCLRICLIATALSGGLTCQTASPPRLGSDVVMLQETDRLSGIIRRVDDAGVELQSHSVGSIKLPWAAITVVRAEKGQARWNSETTFPQSFEVAEFRLINGVPSAFLDG